MGLSEPAQGWAQGCHHWSLEARDGRNFPTLAHEGACSWLGTKAGSSGSLVEGWGGNLFCPLKSCSLITCHQRTQTNLPSQPQRLGLFPQRKTTYTHAQIHFHSRLSSRMRVPELPRMQTVSLDSPQMLLPPPPKSQHLPTCSPPPPQPFPRGGESAY